MLTYSKQLSVQFYFTLNSYIHSELRRISFKKRSCSIMQTFYFKTTEGERGGVMVEHWTPKLIGPGFDLPN